MERGRFGPVMNINRIPKRRPWSSQVFLLSGHIFTAAALDLRNGNLSVVDLHQINVRRALATLLPFRAVLLEFDWAIEAENIHVPHRSANGLRLGLAGDLDGLRDRADAVIATEA